MSIGLTPEEIMLSLRNDDEYHRQQPSVKQTIPIPEPEPIADFTVGVTEGI